jgi:hypothetical protein
VKPEEFIVTCNFRIGAFSAVLLVFPARAQTPPNNSRATATTSQIAPLQAYTAQDGSASARIPSGWQVTRQGQTVIDLAGPQGESISLGNTFIAGNAPYRAGKVAGVDLNLPYQDTLPQKFVLILQHTAGLAGKPVPQITIGSATPVQLPPSFGQCGRFLGSVGGTSDAGPANFEGVMCSLPIDAGGTYKNIFIYGQLPASLASRERTTVEAVMASYTMPPSWLARKLGPNIAPPALPAATVGGSPARPPAAPSLSPPAADHSAECFDLIVLRETPTNQLPAYCR